VPTDRRRQPHGTIGILGIENGQLTEASIVPSPDAAYFYEHGGLGRPERA
jgi:hypothetical protein